MINEQKRTPLISAVMYDRLRPEIRIIAQIMERKFRDHSHRGDPFQHTTWEFLDTRYNEETKEFWDAIKADAGENTVFSEAADRMNFILMQTVKYSEDWRMRNGIKSDRETPTPEAQR